MSCKSESLFWKFILLSAIFKEVLENVSFIKLIK